MKFSGFLAIYEEVCREIGAVRPEKVGILGTKATIDHCFYQNELLKYGISSAVLLPEKEAAFDHHIFEEMLRGRKLGTMKKMTLEAIDELKRDGCDAVILACTELPLFVSQEDSDIPLFSSTGILALYGNDNLRIVRNTISETMIGIYIYPGSTDCKIINNSGSLNTWDFYSYEECTKIHANKFED